MLDTNKMIIGDNSMVMDNFLVPPMLILLIWIPLLLICLLHLHLCHSHLVVFHHYMGLMISHLGCLDNILVIPVKEQVDMVVKCVGV
jgi:hypothetical protein